MTRGERHKGMGRVRIKRLTDHDACFSPVAGVLDAGHMRNDGAIPIKGLIDKAERVRRIPDVGARAGHRKGPTFVGGRAGLSHEADILRLPGVGEGVGLGVGVVLAVGVGVTPVDVFLPT